MTDAGTAAATYRATAHAYLHTPADPRVAPLALAFYQKALALEPEHLETRLALAKAYHELGDCSAALACCETVLKIAPHSFQAQLYQCIFQLPILYTHTGAVEQSRQAYQQRLCQLVETVDFTNPHAVAEAADGIGTVHPFYLAYQAEDDRALQQIYGNFISRVLRTRYPAWATAPALPALKPGEPLRIGVVSGHFFGHVVWQAITQGWMTELDPRRFALFGYALKAKPGPELAEAKASCAHFVEGPRSFEAWCEQIRADRLHVLIYPEIGMNPLALKLAGLRLAPVQCMAWGHPITSGLPTMDYYLSAARMELPGADADYAEQLVRLPNLSICYRVPPYTPMTRTRADFGLRSDAVIYLCIQTLYRYLPQYDELLPRIAQQMDNCQFVFVKHGAAEPLSRMMEKRLERAFAARGLDWKRYVVMLPRMGRDEYHALQALGDIYLDSIGWTGGTTTLNAISHNLPIVTLPGRFFRGRLSAGMLAQMNITQTIAADLDEYVAIATRLGQDAEGRQQVRTQMAQHQDKLFQDRVCIAGLEDFLVQATKDRRG